MPAPFEDPAKTAMIARCRIAIDAAAYTLVEDLEKLSIPDHLELEGVIQGDLQSLNGQGARYCYVVRPGKMTTLPTWIAQWARACHDIPDAHLYVVVQDWSPDFEDACRVAGAGVVALTDSNSFDLVVEFEGNLPAQLDKEFEARVRALRSEMMTKADLRIDEIKERYRKVGSLTSDMSEPLASTYTEEIENAHRLWSDWRHDLGIALDAALTSKDDDALDQIAARIDAGAVPDATDDNDDNEE